jgi:hypothetical protein
MSGHLQRLAARSFAPSSGIAARSSSRFEPDPAPLDTVEPPGADESASRPRRRPGVRERPAPPADPVPPAHPTTPREPAPPRVVGSAEPRADVHGAERVAGAFEPLRVPPAGRDPSWAPEPAAREVTRPAPAATEPPTRLPSRAERAWHAEHAEPTEQEPPSMRASRAAPPDARPRGAAPAPAGLLGPPPTAGGDRVPRRRPRGRERGREPGRESSGDAVVEITIGRVEVRAPVPPSAGARPAPRAAGPTLAEYLSRRNGERR